MNGTSDQRIPAGVHGTSGRLILGHFDPATWLTLAAIILSMLAVAYAARGATAIGVICFMYAGLCDLFDGVVARCKPRSRVQAEFGRQIDSIADMAAFGVAPVMIALHLGLTSASAIPAMVFYACCAALRLAYFNVHGTSGDGERRFYAGVPVTYAALVFPIVLLFAAAPNELPAAWMMQACFWVLGALFVLRIRVPKPTGIFYVIFPLVAVVLTVLWSLRI